MRNDTKMAGFSDRFWSRHSYRWVCGHNRLDDVILDVVIQMALKEKRRLIRESFQRHNWDEKQKTKNKKRKNRKQKTEMRLDKYLTAAGVSTRSATAKAVRAGEITVDGVRVKDAGMQITPGVSRVVLRGVEILWREHIYVMLNKPEGYVSATEDSRAPVVNSLLDERDSQRVFPCGRLDKYTVGLMLLTDDGELSHRLLAPARHVAKTYLYRCRDPLTEDDAEKLRSGVHIEGGYLTAPCGLELLSSTEGNITLTEGKYHQIKQMFGAVGNEITALERITFGPLTLDRTLKRGEWRYLDDREIAVLYEAAELKRTQNHKS